MAGAPPTANLFRNATDAERHAAGEQIFASGDSGQLMYAVQSGEVDLRVGDRVVETVREGGIFGEMALIDGLPRSATAVARTDCALVAIDEKRFNFLVQQTPFFAMHVLRVVAHRLRQMNER